MTNRIPKYIQAIADNPEENPHGLTAKQIADRLYTHKWSLEKTLSTPVMTRTEAARRAAKVSPWGKWQPGLFSEADKYRGR
jgi:hypothetical protein